MVIRRSVHSPTGNTHPDIPCLRCQPDTSKSLGAWAKLESKAVIKRLGLMGKPALPHGVSGKPQRVEGARRNTPPTAFCFESYAVNTGEPGRDVKEGGQ